MTEKRLLIEETEDGKRLLITTYKRYIKSVEKLTANVVAINFEG